MTAAFVDAGYLRGLGVDRLKTTPSTAAVTTADVAIDGPALVSWCRSVAHRFLRAYVYDGEFEPEHDRAARQALHLDELADTEGIRVRLGTLRDRRRRGLEQKGVDTLLVLDMLQLAQQDAYDHALLIAGDVDFLEVVDAVQRLGKHVWVACSETRDGLSKELRQACDGIRPIPNSFMVDLVKHSWH